MRFIVSSTKMSFQRNRWAVGGLVGVVVLTALAVTVLHIGDGPVEMQEDDGHVLAQ